MDNTSKFILQLQTSPYYLVIAMTIQFRNNLHDSNSPKCPEGYEPVSIVHAIMPCQPDSYYETIDHYRVREYVRDRLAMKVFCGTTAMTHISRFGYDAVLFKRKEGVYIAPLWQNKEESRKTFRALVTNPLN